MFLKGMINKLSGGIEKKDKTIFIDKPYDIKIKENINLKKKNS